MVTYLVNRGSGPAWLSEVARDITRCWYGVKSSYCVLVHSA